jgi:catechol 2,3-dioxygenase-like lactoylglutathione lyase family enzyme
MMARTLLGMVLVAVVTSLAAAASSNTLGLFEAQSDVGTVVPAGTGSFDSRTGTYTLTAAGANTWYHIDNFHYLWKKVAGDFVLTADIAFPQVSYRHQPDPHRKGILMFRQTLDAGGKYVGAAWHGSGLTALQFRRERGANAEDVEINAAAPTTARIEKRGDVFTLFLSMRGEPLHQVGASVTLHLEEPFYVGLGALSHDLNTTDTIEFSHVTLQAPSPMPAPLALYSTLQTISINDQFRRAMVIRSVPGYAQSANWAPEGKQIYLHEAGHIERVPCLDPPAGGPPQTVSTGTLLGCSGNFGLSPDGKLLAVSCAETQGGQHDVYVIPADGAASAGAARKVTSGAASSYFHAWAPDSHAIAFTRGRAAKADIFTTSLDGGPERRLTSDTINDAPDYTPDGKWIYFDSSRSGATQIWRMKPDGTAAEQITDDDYINSSPHVSPDGKTVAFLSQVASNPPREPAPDGSDILPTALRVIGSADGLIRTVARFQGSRGSFSMYGWGDVTHLAFVSYQMLPAAAIATSKHPATPRPAITGVSHVAVFATDAAKTERFYAYDLGALKGADPESPQGARYYFAPTQFVEVLPLPAGPPSINRLDHVAFTTSDAEALRKYLASQHIAVPKKIEQGSDGSGWFSVSDPEGNRIEFVQPPPQPAHVPVNPLSHRIIHVGFIVHDRAREDDFFRTVLGFRPYWFGGMTDDKPTWVSQQVPDGTDWLEYMLVGAPETRGIPETMSQANLGVLNHFSLGVTDTRAAYTLLWKEDRLTDQTNTPKIGRDAKWQLNLLDPDGTRAEIMELHAIGTPCCSPFTASDPQP